MGPKQEREIPKMNLWQVTAPQWKQEVTKADEFFKTEIVFASILLKAHLRHQRFLSAALGTGNFVSQVIMTPHLTDTRAMEEDRV